MPPAPSLRTGDTAPRSDDFDAIAQHRYRVRTAPLLWLVLPFAAGIGTGFSFPQVAPLPLLLAALALGIAAAYVAFFTPTEQAEYDCQTPSVPVPAATALPRRLWPWFYITAAFLCGWGYAALRTPPPGPPLAVPREAVLTLEVRRIFTIDGERGYVSGIGRVLQTPDYLPALEDNLVSFSLRTQPHFLYENQTLLKGAQIAVKGRLANIDAPPPQRWRNHQTAQPAAGSPAPKQTTDRGRDGFHHYLRSQGVRYLLDSGSVTSVEFSGSAWRQMCESVRQKIHTALRIGADSPQTERLANIGIAMLLGETRALDAEEKSAFVLSGTMHLFAVSGLHVVLIAAALAAAGEFLGLRRSRVAVIGIALLWVYVEVVGAPPSAVRAWWMSALFWSAIALRRQASPLSAMCASMLVILLIEPRQLLNIGFQLSYAVVAGILLYALPLADTIGHWALRQKDRAHLRLRRYPLFPPKPWYLLSEKSRRYVLSLFTISLTGMLYSTPLVLGAFGNFAPGGLLVNMLLVPLSFWILCALLLAAACGVTGLLWPASLFNHSAWLLLAVMTWCAQAAIESPVGFYSGLAWNWPQYGMVSCLALLAASLLGRHTWFEKHPIVQQALIPALWLTLLFVGLTPWPSV